MEFKKRFSEEYPDEPIECSCCNYPGRVAKFDQTMVSERHHEHNHLDIWLCEICANTHLSVAFKYPDQCPDRRLYTSIAVIGNMLLEAIRKEE